MTTEPLALKYRPRKFGDVAGQPRVTALLQTMVATGNVPPALVFSGMSGAGKTSTARILAAGLNCEDLQGGEPCGTCSACVAAFNGTLSALIEIDGASAGGVEDVRRLQETLQYAYFGKWRVVMLDECHSMSKDAFNALLKLLEEPPPSTVFVLLTTEVSKIPLTVLNRGWDLEFRKLALKDIVVRLQAICDAEQLTVETQLLVEIAKSAEGGLRKAVMLLDQSLMLGVDTAPKFKEWFGVSDYGYELLWAAVTTDVGSLLGLAEDAVTFLGSLKALTSDVAGVARDLLLLSSGAALDLPDIDVEKRQKLMQYIDVGKLPQILSLTVTADKNMSGDFDVVKSAQIFAVLVQNSLKQATQLPKTPIIEKEYVSPAASLAWMRELAGTN